MTESAQRTACPSCQYDLRSHVTAEGATCPECGGIFSLEALRPDRERKGRFLVYLHRWERVLLWLIFTPPLVGAVIMAIGTAVWYDRPPAWAKELYFAVVLTGGVVQLAAALWCGRRMDPPWPWWAGVCAGIILAVVSLLMHFVTGIAVMMIMM